MRTWILGRGLFVLTMGAVFGCGSGSHDGTLQQNWTIAGGTDPAACTRVHATQMRLVVLDHNGLISATQFAPCTDFKTTLSLQADSYSGTATFLDQSNVVVSKTLLVTSFGINEGQTTALTLPFQLTDFL
jgi:hypothetical protein